MLLTEIIKLARYLGQHSSLSQLYVMPLFLLTFGIDD